MAQISNDEFLRACFGTDWMDAHVCAFAVDPNEAGPLWAGGRWGRTQDTARFRHENAYFAISLFRDDPAAGRARRTKALFRATHVIVIDDAGTKVPFENIPVALREPSWKLETSPGNFQWGYILDAPETDAGRVNALLDQMVAGGLCPDGTDPGMKGVTRYVRLPEGRNTKAKYGPAGFACRLTEWDPSRRFATDQIAVAFGFTLPAPGAVSVAPTRPAIQAQDDPIYALLDGWGMIRGRAADPIGYDLECPWLADHTGRADTGAAYWPGGGMKCHHGHCADRGRAELLAWVNERLRTERGHGLAALDFMGADKPQIDAFWNILAVSRVPVPAEIDNLARVPNRPAVLVMLDAADALLGSATAPIRRALTRAWKRQAREAKSRKRTADQPSTGRAVALPEGTAAPVSLAEAQAAMDAELQAILSAPVNPVIVLLRNDQRRAW